MSAERALVLAKVLGTTVEWLVSGRALRPPGLSSGGCREGRVLPKSKPRRRAA